MSITINKQPQDLMPVYNQMIIAVTGSYQLQSSHQFTALITTRNIEVSSLKIPANPDGFGVFDIHKHIEGAISWDFNPGAEGLYVATQSFATYSVSFGEQFRFQWGFTDNFFFGGNLAFIGPSGGSAPLFSTGSLITVAQLTPFSFSAYEGEATITAIQYITASNAYIVGVNKAFAGNTPVQGGTMALANFGLTTVNSTQSIPEKGAFNGVYSFLDFLSYDDYNYIPQTATPSLWLTNVPQNYPVATYSRLFLNAYKTTNNQQRVLVVQSNTGTFTYSNPYSAAVSTNDRFRLVGAAVGPHQLITSTAGWSGGTFPIINSLTSTYSVFYRNSSGTQDTRALVFKVQEYCSMFEKIQLVFGDKLGSHVSFIFSLVSRETKSIARTDFGQITGNYAPASQAWDYRSYDRGKKNLDTVVTQQFRITSDWINQSQSNYLMELFESPEVYWINEDGVGLAINITDTTVERKKTINDGVINYNITFELSNKSNNQRG